MSGRAGWSGATGLVLVGVGAAACGIGSRRVPQQVIDGFATSPCHAEADEASRVARITYGDGGWAELWLAPSAEGGSAAIVVAEDGAGTAMTGGGGCAVDAGEGLTVQPGPSLSTGRGGWLYTFGRAGPEAESVRLSFGAETDTVDVQVGDYFLAATEAGMAAGASVDGRPDKVEAIDGDGDVVESLEL